MAEEIDRLRAALIRSRRVRSPAGYGEICARIAPHDTVAFVLPDGGGKVQEWALTLLEPCPLNAPSDGDSNG